MTNNIRNNKWILKWNKISNLEILLILHVDISSEKPRTRRRFDTLEPITFPTARSGEFFKIASTETKSSDREVPKPTIIIPIRKSETLYLLPKAMAADNKISAPWIRRINPRKRKKVWFNNILKD